jgi:hypothetical protein
MLKIKSTTTSDFKQLDSLFKRLDTIEKYDVEYGYFEGDVHESSGLEFVDLVTILNEGDGVHLPPRPFMELAYNSVDRHFEVDKRWKERVWQYLSGTGNIISLMKDMGKIGQNHVEDAIIFGMWEENAPDWAAYKFSKYGHSIPLIETTEMLESVKSKVNKHDQT